MVALPLLAVAGFISWSGVEAKQAFDGGALDRPLWCAEDRALVREERNGGVKDETRIRGLTAQVALYEGLFDHYTIFRSVREFGWHLAIDIFWSADDRKSMFDKMRRKMRPCRSMSNIASL